MNENDGNLFYAAFIPGLQNVIADAINERLRNNEVKIHKLLDGAVLFETDATYDKLNFFCFNNIFAVISVLEDSHTGTRRHGGNILNEHIIKVTEGINNTNVIKNNSKKFNTFRIVASDENVPASISEKLRTEAENFIAKLSGLKVNRSLPDTEFWFLYRNEDNNNQNFSIFMKRLTIRPSWEKTLHKGELVPPLAWVLCRLANIKHSDTVLDPFCGYGSIPEAAFKYFHITNFIACDNDSEAAKYSTARFKKQKSASGMDCKDKFKFYKTDFCELPALLKGITIDAIVTDPPWGHFKEYDEDLFLPKMFETFDKLLKEGGRAVVLYKNDENFKNAISASFEFHEQIPILLSGKKAIIFVFRKNPPCLRASV
ncbi:MAG: methyltransferase [Treponema sp.]|nr:methyltransferase [Treponema sp.]MCL2238176.1 methyltransferase [Treponema sp.]